MDAATNHIYNTVYMCDIYIYNISWVQSFGVSVLSPSSLYTLVPWSFKQTGSQSAGGGVCSSSSSESRRAKWISSRLISTPMCLGLDNSRSTPTTRQNHRTATPNVPGAGWWGGVRASLPLKGRTTVLDGGR